MFFSRTLELSWSRFLDPRGPQARRGATRIVRAQITYCTDARLPTFYDTRTHAQRTFSQGTMALV